MNGYTGDVLKGKRTLLSLKERLDEILEHEKEMGETVGNEEAYELIKNANIPEDEWRPYAFFHKSKYTRNLIASGDNYDMILLCWNKGMASAVHDHGGSNCWMKCLHGDMRETLYENHEGKPLHVLKKSDLAAGQLAYIHGKSNGLLFPIYFTFIVLMFDENSLFCSAYSLSGVHFPPFVFGITCFSSFSFFSFLFTVLRADSLGLHKVENTVKDEVAVSLHIYSPPITRCKKFNPRTGAAFECGMQFFSKYGELCEAVQEL